MPPANSVAGVVYVVPSVVAAAAQPAQFPTAGLVGKDDCAAAIKIRYPALPATAVQVNVGGIATPVAPFTGAVRVGAGNVAPIVKLKMFDHAAVPLLEVGSMACTSQKYSPAVRGLDGV